MNVSDRDIVVLLPTFNRAEILEQTCNNFTEVDQSGIDWELVIIDNNSSDATAQVAESFKHRLPLRYMHVSQQGKNVALNHALSEAPLGRLVVFTDDDVKPDKDWLQKIAQASDRWLTHSVFGGQVYLIYPEPKEPYWDAANNLPGLGFGKHAYAPEECEYSPDRPGFRYASGANFWVRREVFAEGRRFHEALGPRPNGRIMGGETSFLKELENDGYTGVYSPEVRLGHYLQMNDLQPETLRKRAYRNGRWLAHYYGLRRMDLLQKHPFVWYMRRFLVLCVKSFLYISSYVHFTSQKRILRSLTALRMVGKEIESFRVAQSYLNELEP
jgi:hypothetical protein